MKIGRIGITISGTEVTLELGEIEISSDENSSFQQLVEKLSQTIKDYYQRLSEPSKS